MSLTEKQSVYVVDYNGNALEYILDKVDEDYELKLVYINNPNDVRFTYIEHLLDNRYVAIQSTFRETDEGVSIFRQRQRFIQNLVRDLNKS
tara:strand:+ start:2099 stop:2371 length:273 start_codon:yes stop_codon:yes gene_type:complete